MIGKVIVKNTNTEWFIIKHHSLKKYKEKMQRKKKGLKKSFSNKIC